jgi:hypothetical protein
MISIAAVKRAVRAAVAAYRVGVIAYELVRLELAQKPALMRQISKK